MILISPAYGPAFSPGFLLGRNNFVIFKLFAGHCTKYFSSIRRKPIANVMCPGSWTKYFGIKTAMWVLTT